MFQNILFFNEKMLCYTYQEYVTTKDYQMKLKTKSKEEIPSYMKRESAKPAKTKTTKKENIHVGHRERLKKQYIQNGIHTMTDIQRLELLLFYAIPQKDTNPIAHALLKKFGNIKNVLNASVRDLCTVEGIKESSATYLKIVSNMANVCSLPEEGELIPNSATAKKYCSKFYVGIQLEQFHVVCLSKDNKVIGTKMIKSGSTDQINVEIRDITEFAMSINCNRIIVSHNHPNGIGKMSDEDFKYTYSLVCSCILNSIELLDHIVVGSNSCFSFDEHNLIEKLKNRAFDKVLIPKETQLFLSNLSKNYVKSETHEMEVDFDF